MGGTDRERAARPTLCLALFPGRAAGRRRRGRALPPPAVLCGNPITASVAVGGQERPATVRAAGRRRRSGRHPGDHRSRRIVARGPRAGPGRRAEPRRAAPADPAVSSAHRGADTGWIGFSATVPQCGAPRGGGTGDRQPCERAVGRPAGEWTAAPGPRDPLRRRSGLERFLGAAGLFGAGARPDRIDGPRVWLRNLRRTKKEASTRCC